VRGADLDHLLVQRCLGGQPGAWDALYEQFHQPLCQAIRRLAGAAADANLLDEIAARVWYALVRSDFELLSRFDAERGCRLSTFLAAIARKEFAAYARGERRRRVREQAVSKSCLQATLHDLAASRADLVEFMNSLTPRERMFCEQWLMSGGDERPHANRDGGLAPGALSDANIRQLRHRIRRKLIAYLESR